MDFFFLIVVKGKGNECWERCLFIFFSPPPFGNSDENCRSLRQDWFARRFKIVEKLIDAIESIFFFISSAKIYEKNLFLFLE